MYLADIDARIAELDAELADCHALRELCEKPALAPLIVSAAQGKTRTPIKKGQHVLGKAAKRTVAPSKYLSPLMVWFALAGGKWVTAREIAEGSGLSRPGVKYVLDRYTQRFNRKKGVGRTMLYQLNPDVPINS